MTKKAGVDIVLELRLYIARHHVTQAAAAKHWGCSAPFLSQVLSRKKVPTEAMLKEVGFKRVEFSPAYVKA